MDTRKAEHISGIAAAVLIAGLLFLFNPAQLYFTNINDFGAPLTIALPLLLGAFVLTVAALAGVQYVAGRFEGRVTSLLVAVAVLLWLQSNVFLWNYGVLDGTEPNWSRFKLHGRLELLAWLVLIGAALWRPKPTIAAGTRILPVLLLMQIASVAVAIVRAEPAPDFHRYTVVDGHKYDLSNERNVVVVVLDAFQSDIFAELVAKEPALRNSLDGFTWYRDTTAGFAKTYPSVTLFHTGRYYENDRPLRQFMAEAFLTDSVPLRLKSAGWDVGLYPYVERTLYFDDALAHNFVPRVPATPRVAVFADLVDPALFRMVPHVLKKRVLNNYEWVLSSFMKTAAAADEGRPERRAERDARDLVRSEHPHHDVRFAEEFAANAVASIDAPAFRYYHLLSPHAPFALDRNLNMTLLPADRAGFAEHSRAAIAIVERLVAKLQALEVYDKTAVVVVSDHGGGKYFPGIATEYAGREVTARRPGHITGEEQASAMSLMLVKPFGSRGEMRVSDAPVSNADLAATLDRLTLDQGGFPGMPVQDVAENAERERRHLFYRFQSWRPAYLPDLREYLIRGHSWDPASWTETGKVYAPAEQYVPPELPEDFRMPVGEEVLTRYGSPGVVLLESGWSSPESDFTWSNANRAALRLPFEDELSEEIAISLRLNPYRGGGKLPPPRIVIRNGEHELFDDTMERYGMVTVRTTLDAEGLGELHLELELPDAISPHRALLGLDQRTLGVAVYGIRVDPVTRIEHGDKIDFSSDGNALAYRLDGWSTPESWATWSDGERSEVRLPLDAELHGEAVTLEFNLRPYVVESKLPEQRVRILVNGEPHDEWVLSEPGKPRLTVPSRLTQSGELLLTFVLPDASVPADIEDAEDIRKLGIALNSIKVRRD